MSGSVNSMEPDGAETLWAQSEDKRSLRYTTFVGDGDLSSFGRDAQLSPYGPENPAEKEECVGHIQKRMGTGPPGICQKSQGQEDRRADRCGWLRWPHQKANQLHAGKIIQARKIRRRWGQRKAASASFFLSAGAKDETGLAPERERERQHHKQFFNWSAIRTLMRGQQVSVLQTGDGGGVCVTPFMVLPVT